MSANVRRSLDGERSERISKRQPGATRLRTQRSCAPSSSFSPPRGLRTSHRPETRRSLQTTSKGRKRCCHRRLEGLRDQPRCGAPLLSPQRRFTPRGLCPTFVTESRDRARRNKRGRLAPPPLLHGLMQTTSSTLPGGKPPEAPALRVDRRRRGVQVRLPGRVVIAGFAIVLSG